MSENGTPQASTEPGAQEPELKATVAALQHTPEEAAMFHRMTIAVARCMQIGAPPTYAITVAQEALIQVLVAKGLMTMLEIMEAQAVFAEAQYDQQLVHKVAADIEAQRRGGIEVVKH